MKVSKIIGERLKEKPSNVMSKSHEFMIRGGYVKMVSNGIYSFYPLMMRIFEKIKNIIKSEMEKIDAEEVLMPVVLPSKLWEKSGRYISIGKELLRFEDRTKAKMVLGMTHEEAAVSLVKEYANTYLKYPFCIYQIQTKFRDEARPRAGLIRTKEFVMKDAYSFHTSYEDLQEYYDRCKVAYNNIFKKCGLKDFVCIKGDSGIMGGDISHEYMALSDIGEDSLIKCVNCDYIENIEIAECIVNNKQEEIKELKKIETKDIISIEDLSKKLNIRKDKICKAVIYKTKNSNKTIVVFIRGDLEVNEIKLQNIVKDTIEKLDINENSNLKKGYIGPIGLKDVDKIIYDISLKDLNNLVCGANETNYHYENMNILRDVGEVNYSNIAIAFEGSICPKCGNKLKIIKGIEIGNIFQLGTKYSESMKLYYMDDKGNKKLAIMGCYGIGLARLISSICEQSCDDYGPIWPITISPYNVHICLLNKNFDKSKKFADKLYENLLDKNVEVLYDDRDVSPGIMFNDADLIGVPIRVIISKKNILENIVEIRLRDKSIYEKIKIEDIENRILTLIEKLKNELK